MTGRELLPSAETMSVQNNVRFYELMLCTLLMGNPVLAAIVAFLSCMVAAGLVWWSTGNSAGLVLVAMGGAVLVGLPLGFYGQYQQQKNFFQNSTVSLSPAGLVTTVNFASAESRLDWTQVRAVNRFANVLIIKLDTQPESSILVPLRCFSSDDEARRFCRLSHEYWRSGQARLHDLGKCHPAKKIDKLLIKRIALAGVALALLVSLAINQSAWNTGAVFVLALGALFVSRNWDTGQGALIHSNAALAANDNKRALLICKNALKKFPANAALHVNAGFSLYNLGQWEEGLEHCEAAKNADPSLAVAHAGVSYGARELGQTEKAISEISTALELAPNLTWAYVIRAGIFAEENRYDEALKDCERAASIEPGYYGTNIVSAVVHLFRREYDQAKVTAQLALEQCEASKRTAKERANALVVLSVTMSRLAEHEAAWATVQQAIEVDPWRAEHIAIAGANRSREGKYEEASALFTQALEKKPTQRFLPTIYSDIAINEIHLGKLESANEYADKALAAARRAYALAAKGAVLVKQGKFEEALPLLDEALEKDPYQAVAHEYRGQIQ